MWAGVKLGRTRLACMCTSYTNSNSFHAVLALSCGWAKCNGNGLYIVITVKSYHLPNTYVTILIRINVPCHIRRKSRSTGSISFEPEPGSKSR